MRQMLPSLRRKNEVFEDQGLAQGQRGGDRRRIKKSFFHSPEKHRIMPAYNQATN